MRQIKVGVGSTYLFGAQAVFMVSAYAMHIILGRYLGPVEYGTFGVVLYAATIIRSFVASGLPVAVSKYTSAEPDKSESILRRSLKLQFYLASTISVLFFLLAPRLANLLGDPQLTHLFRIVAPITIFFGIFFLIIQHYNGLHQYFQQACWLAVSYLLRALFGIGLAIIGYRVLGAVTGLVVASCIATVLILVMRKKGSITEDFPSSDLIVFSIPLVFASIAHGFLVDIDLMFVKRLVPDAASAGHYTSAKALAHATPFAFYALSAALFPAISKAYSSNDLLSFKSYVWKANRILIMVALPIALVVIKNSESLLSLLYGISYIDAAPALRWLMFAFACLAMFMVHKSIITGCGFPKISSAITVLLLPVCITLQILLVPVLGLTGAAIASAITFFTGLMTSTVIIHFKLRAGFNLLSSVRIIISVIGLYLADLLLTYLGFPILLKLISMLFIYSSLLCLLKEVHPRQIVNFAMQVKGGRKESSGEVDDTK